MQPCAAEGSLASVDMEVMRRAENMEMPITRLVNMSEKLLV